MRRLKITLIDVAERACAQLLPVTFDILLNCEMIEAPR